MGQSKLSNSCSESFIVPAKAMVCHVLPSPLSRVSGVAMSQVPLWAEDTSAIIMRG